MARPHPSRPQSERFPCQAAEVYLSGHMSLQARKLAAWSQEKDEERDLCATHPHTTGGIARN